jgi:hypothetical protein
LKNSLRSRIELIIDLLEKNSIKYFSSHLRENWGKVIISKRKIADRDFSELENSTHLIAYIGSDFSIGTWIEIGFAISRKIKILILLENSKVKSELLDSLRISNYLKLIHISTKTNLEKIIIKHLST